MVSTKYILTTSTLALALIGGCTANEDSDTTSRAGAVEAVTPEAADEVAPAEGPTTETWQAWVTSENQRIQSADPVFYDKIMHMPTKRTRAGFPRLIDPALHNPDAAPILIQRLLDGSDDAATRGAIADALPRTQGHFGAAAASMIATEADPQVRVLLVGTLNRAESEHALAGLTTAFADSDLEVQRSAARIAGARVDGSELSAHLLAALDSGDTELRGVAARSLGVLAVDEAKAPIAELLNDSDANVRLHSLRALSRIDPEYAAALPNVDSMQQDQDKRVANVASKIVASR